VRTIDWIILAASLAFFVIYGLWKSRKKQEDLDGYLLADRDQRWYTVALAIMATQASAITFLSTPGQAYTDGMRFVQFYFGLPIAMVILSITAVPIFHRLKVYTAYEYLESRFDLKTRSLAALLFLVQRGLACGLTIYAPAVILSVLLGWNLQITIVSLGAFVVIYTAAGGTKAVNETNFQQMIIVMLGMFAAFVVVILSLPTGVSIGDAVFVAGKLGKLNAITTTVDWNDRYNIWSGIIGGCFLALSYFGTDQSQVGRYLSGQSVTQSRLGLLFNGIVKIPMQFFILFVGAMVFALYQFVAPPLFFNSVAVERARSSAEATAFSTIEQRFEAAAAEKAAAANALVDVRRSGNAAEVERATANLRSADEKVQGVRSEGIDLIQRVDPKAERSDTNYVFLTFILQYLPAGLVGLVMAAVFAAAMSSTASELNALGSTTIVDLYKRMIRRNGSERHYVRVSQIVTAFWGAVAIGFALYANRLGSLVEAVNIIGSMFYGTILGIFLVAFYMKRAGGHAVFAGAIAGQTAVFYFKFATPIAFLWLNVIGCAVVAVVAFVISFLLPPRVSAESA
jgi:solute:Na+ symporter, SSS family